MKHSFLIKNKLVQERAQAQVGTIPLDELHEVIIRPYKKDRTLLQNAYYWVILTIIGKDLGYSKNEMHREYKGKFLVPIMLKYPKDYPEFCEMFAAIIDLRDSGSEADSLIAGIISLVSTAKLKVAHMAELITDIKNHATGLDIRLPAPEYD